MNRLKVTIELDPVNDGAVFAESSFKKKEEGALIIGTNGEKRIAGVIETQKILDSFIEKKRTFALDYQGKVIGSLGVEYYSETESPELDSMRTRALGFVLSKDYWGRGLMPEAVEAVLGYGFTQLGLRRIWCGHYAGNWRSSRVIGKCGFHYRFSRTEYVSLVNETRQSYFYVQTEEDWRERVSGAL